MLKLFGCEASSSSLDDARCTYFKSLNTQDLNKSLRHLALLESLLMTKILRSNLVAAHIWGNVLNYQDPDPTQYGWIIERSTEHLVADLANKEEELGTLVKAVTVTCSCSTKSVKNKCSICKCGNMKVACLDFCKCSRVCQG